MRRRRQREPHPKGWDAVNQWVEAALKWIGERVGYALGALVHQCVAFLLGLVGAMGRYLLGRYWDNLRWLARAVFSAISLVILW